MVAAGEFDPGLHMTMVGSLDQAPRALEMVKNTETDGKIVLYPHISPTPPPRPSNGSEATSRRSCADDHKCSPTSLRPHPIRSTSTKDNEIP